MIDETNAFGFDSRTEFLSQHGWRRIQNWRLGIDLVASLRDDMVVDFINAKSLIKTKIQKFWHIKSPFLDQCVDANGIEHVRRELEAKSYRFPATRVTTPPRRMAISKNAVAQFIASIMGTTERNRTSIVLPNSFLTNIESSWYKVESAEQNSLAYIKGNKLRLDEFWYRLGRWDQAYLFKAFREAVGGLRFSTFNKTVVGYMQFIGFVSGFHSDVQIVDTEYVVTFYPAADIVFPKCEFNLFRNKADVSYNFDITGRKFLVRRNNIISVASGIKRDRKRQ